MKKHSNSEHACTTCWRPRCLQSFVIEWYESTQVSEHNRSGGSEPWVWQCIKTTDAITWRKMHAALVDEVVKPSTSTLYLHFPLYLSGERGQVTCMSVLLSFGFTFASRRNLIRLVVDYSIATSSVASEYGTSHVGSIPICSERVT